MIFWFLGVFVVSFIASWSLVGWLNKKEEKVVNKEERRVKYNASMWNYVALLFFIFLALFSEQLSQANIGGKWLNSVEGVAILVIMLIFGRISNRWIKKLPAISEEEQKKVSLFKEALTGQIFIDLILLGIAVFISNGVGAGLLFLVTALGRYMWFDMDWEDIKINMKRDFVECMREESCKGYVYVAVATTLIACVILLFHFEFCESIGTLGVAYIALLLAHLLRKPKNKKSKDNKPNGDCGA